MRDIKLRGRLPSVNTLTCIWDISWSHDASDLFHALQIWTQSSMATENLFINNGRNWQTVEAVGERFPQFDVIATLTWDT
jgi:hypothetical protein